MDLCEIERSRCHQFLEIIHFGSCDNRQRHFSRFIWPLGLWFGVSRLKSGNHSRTKRIYWIWKSWFRGLSSKCFPFGVRDLNGLVKLVSCQLVDGVTKCQFIFSEAQTLLHDTDCVPKARSFVRTSRDSRYEARMGRRKKTWTSVTQIILVVITLAGLRAFHRALEVISVSVGYKNTLFDWWLTHVSASETNTVCAAAQALMHIGNTQNVNE